MSRAVTRQPKVELLPITKSLIRILEKRTPEERREIFAKAKVPDTSYHAWRLGYYHPTTTALTRLLKAMGRELQIILD